MRVSSVNQELTYSLRREVLGWKNTVSEYDALPDASHFAVTSPEGTVFAVGSSGSLNCPLFPDSKGYKFWAIAVEHDKQGLGLGRLIIDHVLNTAINSEKEILWADSRQTALDFYERVGFKLSDLDRPFSPNTNLRNYMIYREL
ncbi:MAG TPA: GNAT family N-acetyltransferase [Candidatus Saccharimonadales bacterium]|nr:GNAT family N-acetyltransferase [Candidatus Saccharimonadales bacterium]